MRKNTKVSLTMLYFDRECFYSIVKNFESQIVSSSDVKGTSSQSNLLEVYKESDTSEVSTSNSNNSLSIPIEGTSTQSNLLEVSIKYL